MKGIIGQSLGLSISLVAMTATLMAGPASKAPAASRESAPHGLEPSARDLLPSPDARTGRSRVQRYPLYPAAAPHEREEGY